MGGMSVEIFPSQRATVQLNSAGQIVSLQGTQIEPVPPLSATTPVRVFNHAYQQYGYATGEIVFKLRNKDISTASFVTMPGFKKVGQLDLYVVTARTPTELFQLIQRLEENQDVQWVVPTINYVSDSDK